MAILNDYNNPKSGQGSLIRFKQGQVTPAGNTYQAYGRNDETALYSSALHYEDPKLPGYSMDGTPNVKLANTLYNASQTKPSQNLDLSPNPIGDAKSGFQQKYLPNQELTYEQQVEAADIAARAGVSNRTPAGNRNSGDGKNVGGNRQ
eukprot:SAG11_NODE_2_length_63684_cov_167.801195_48_plen_148_part_00